MSREDVGQLLFSRMHDMNLMRGLGTDSEIELVLIADGLVDALWPVLAQVWAEGYLQGVNDEIEDRGYIGEPEGTPNPYTKITPDLSTT